MEIDFMEFEFSMFMGSSFGQQEISSKKNVFSDNQIDQLLQYANAQRFITQDIMDNIKGHTLELRKQMQDRTKKVKIAESRAEEITCAKMRRDPRLAAYVQNFLTKCRKLEMKAQTMEKSQQLSQLIQTHSDEESLEGMSKHSQKRTGKKL